MRRLYLSWRRSLKTGNPMGVQSSFLLLVQEPGRSVTVFPPTSR